jgi:hypothetical protein
MPEEQGFMENHSNFTPRAQQAIALARKEAQRLNHNFLGTEHLMLGIVKLGQGTAFNVLSKLGVDLENLRAEIEKQVGTGPDQETIGNIPNTPRVKKVLELAQKEARQLHHNYVGTEHILLGLLREGDGIAAKVLRGLGVDLKQTRTEILRELDPNYSPEPGTGDAKTNASEEEAAESTRIKVEKAMHKWWSDLPKPDPADLSKRYDVYCIQYGEARVYRNVLIKGVKGLLAVSGYDASSLYLELEQADGKSVFLPKHSVFKFCDPGANASGEKVPPED